ncbi:hypothetical protein ACVIGV_005426 [Rhizobium leguminosarum]
MVVPVKFVVACAAADDIFVIATIPDELPEDTEFTRLYYLCPETEEVWHYRDWPQRTGGVAMPAPGTGRSETRSLRLDRGRRHRNRELHQ